LYAKIFDQIFASSIAEDYTVRHVFMDLLVLADPHGVVDMTPEAISRSTNVPLEIVLNALQKLSQPDPRSRSTEDDGRRIMLLDYHRDWGWQIVNFVNYHKIQDQNQRRQYFREYRRKRRSQGKDLNKQAKLPLESTPVHNVHNVHSEQCEQFNEFRHVDVDVDRVVVSGIQAESTPENSLRFAQGPSSPLTLRGSSHQSLSFDESVNPTKPLVEIQCAEKTRKPANDRVSEQERSRWFDEEFWITGVIWKKIGTGAARRAWLKHVSTRTQATQVIAAARVQSLAILAHAAANNHSVLHPSTWINQERWLDDAAAAGPLQVPEPLSKYEQKLDERLKNAALRQRRSESGK